MKKNQDIPFSYPVKIGHISANPVEVRLAADEEERAGLARLWNVLSVDAFSAQLQVNRWKKDGVRIKGRVMANIVQSCVVTLEPVKTKIDEPIDAVFVPEGSKLARIYTGEDGEMFLDPEGPDAPDVFSGDAIDAGEVAAEHAALAIDPYPRKPGVAFAGHVESTEKDERKPSPFAVLKDWKKD
ncbi:MAG: DUF177 domain-containing protein [Shinella sp.]|nr:DUF177 domain-containing protein [Shinella sp.]